jgi:hypothetical protein
MDFGGEIGPWVTLVHPRERTVQHCPDVVTLEQATTKETRPQMLARRRGGGKIFEKMTFPPLACRANMPITTCLT